MKRIATPDEINLTQHAVIEASAGTGKTFTITRLVLRLLLEQKLTISQILLVTFTDKATSELKARIYQVLTEQLSRPELGAEQRQLLVQALRDLNLASIHTIHGFCQRVLKEYAFEQGALLDKTLVDDNAVILQQLQALKRTWPAIDDIESKLVNTGLKMGQLDQLLIDLVKQSRSGDHLHPDSVAAAMVAAEELLQPFNTHDLALEEASFKAIEGLSTRIKNNRWKDKLKGAVDRLHELKADPLNSESIAAMLPEIKQNYADIIKSDDIKKNPALKSHVVAPVFFAYYQQLGVVITALDAVVKADNYRFVIDMVLALRARVKQHKVSHGQISFNDMIADLSSALTAESKTDQQPLTWQLRKRYQVALIDEFQDTDEPQWRIFQRLFASPNTNQRLVLIGDPKQAIYGFRGANIHIYEQAKEFLLHPEQAGGAYRLSTNYRSLPALTAALNQFFTFQDSSKHQPWYPAAAVAVDSPSKSLRKEIGGPLLLKDESGLGCINAVYASGEGLLVNDLKQQLAQHIAVIIQQQLLQRLEFTRKGITKLLDAGDVCILVRSKKEAIPIEHALDQINIPYSFYKKTELFQSVAAVQIQIILTALAFPHMRKQVNNAWLGLFFRLRSEQIKQLNEPQAVNHADADLTTFMQLWLTIKTQAAQHNWIGVFHSLYENTGVTAELYATGQLRLLANLQQIKQELLKVGLGQKLDAKGMLYQLLEWRSTKLIKADDWQQKDTEQPAVQIMTIHSSKGLEFPVVFLFGGFNAPKQPSKFCKYYDPQRQAQVFDLADPAAKAFVDETAAENKRLYYVAMTRAVFKLFLPVYDRGTYAAKDAFYQRHVLERLVVSRLADNTEPTAQETLLPDLLTPSPQRPPSRPALKLSINHRKRTIHSFSSLQRRGSEADTVFGVFTPATTEQADDPNDWLSIEQEQPSIPGGAQTGNVLHGIFENLDFSLINQQKNLSEFIKNQQVIELIEGQMNEFMMADGEIKDADGKVLNTYRDEFAGWVWHTLKKPIKSLNGLRLCELTAANRRHEMSFYWSNQGQVLTGFIDLLFKVPGADFDAYYILDWKSNFSSHGYAPSTLSDHVMSDHNYHDQYRWYTLAVKSWFARLGLKQARLVGALYLFSRGINSESAASDGVFYQDLTTPEYAPASLADQLHQQIAAQRSTPEKWP